MFSRPYATTPASPRPASRSQKLSAPAAQGRREVHVSSLNTAVAQLTSQSHAHEQHEDVCSSMSGVPAAEVDAMPLRPGCGAVANSRLRPWAAIEVNAGLQQPAAVPVPVLCRLSRSHELGSSSAGENSPVLPHLATAPRRPKGAGSCCDDQKGCRVAIEFA